MRHSPSMPYVALVLLHCGRVGSLPDTTPPVASNDGKTDATEASSPPDSLSDATILDVISNATAPNVDATIEAASQDEGTAGASDATLEDGGPADVAAESRSAVDSPSCSAGPIWTFTGPMATPRDWFTLDVLPDGRALAVGGENSMDPRPQPSAELYDPATGLWTPTGSLMTARFAHSSAVLSDGRVLVAGGYVPDSARPWLTTLTASAELYDPRSGAWSSVSPMTTARVLFTLSSLPTGKVLAAGGVIDSMDQATASAELFDPATGLWTATGSMSGTAVLHTSTVLLDGKVLVAGIAVNASVTLSEAYDPLTETWSTSARMTDSRDNFSAVRLLNGKVLAAGGMGPSWYMNTAEIYDPVNATWSQTGSLMTGRIASPGALLPSGEVILAGGGSFGVGPVVSSAERYDPVTGSWSAEPPTNVPREMHSGVFLPSVGKFLVAGGSTEDDSGISIDTNTAELFTPPCLESADAGVIVDAAANDAVLDAAGGER